jgi:AraC family transcriptional regulator
MSDHLQPHGLFRSPLLALYDVDCHAPRGNSSTEEEMTNHTLVFPRSGVFIKKVSEKDQLVADSTRVLFFNRHETCRFSHPADGGDKCTSIRFQAQPLVDFLQSVHSPVADSPERPFRSSTAVSTSSLALKLHRLRRLILFAQSDNALAIEETCASLLTEALANAGEEHTTELRKNRDSTRKAHRDLVDATRVVLARRFREKLSLAELARAVFSSPFHLARIFRCVTGTTLHHQQNRLRLRCALEHLANGKVDLTMLALDLGFSSHSHFTQAFRSEFCCAPSEFRRQLSAYGRRYLRAVLKSTHPTNGPRHQIR